MVLAERSLHCGLGGHVCELGRPRVRPRSQSRVATFDSDMGIARWRWSQLPRSCSVVVDAVAGLSCEAGARMFQRSESSRGPSHPRSYVFWFCLAHN